MDVDREELQKAIWNYLTRWPEFVPDVEVSDLERDGDAYRGELFLAFRRLGNGSVAQLREAAARVREGIERGEILGGRIRVTHYEEGIEGPFSDDGREVVTLPIRITVEAVA